MKDTAKKTGANKIILAHTADDQAETVLWRMLRGAVGGLAGIPAMRRLDHAKIFLARPFLSVRKKDILGFLREQKIPYRLDASNKSMQFTRNRIRNRLIPYLTKHHNPALVPSLNAMAMALAQQKDLLDVLTQKNLSRGILKEMPSTKGPAISIQIVGLQKLHPALRVEILKKAYELAGGDMDTLKNEHVQQLMALSGPVTSHKRSFAGGVWAAREQNRIVLRRGKKNEPLLPSMRSSRLKIPGITLLPRQGRIKSWLLLRKSRATPWKGPHKKSGIHIEYFDWDSLQSPLTLRQRKSGDRYQPIGLHGTKKIKDILMEKKIPLSMRERYPLLVDSAGRILWMAGYRIAEFCKVRPSTHKVLAVEATFKPN